MFPFAVLDITDAVTLLGGIIDVITDVNFLPYLAASFMLGAAIYGFRKLARSGR